MTWIIVSQILQVSHTRLTIGVQARGSSNELISVTAQFKIPFLRHALMTP